MRPDAIGALDGVTTKEDGPVQSDDGVVALFDTELDGKPTGVPALVGVLPSESGGGEVCEDGRLLTNPPWEVCFLFSP